MAKTPLIVVLTWTPDCDNGRNNAVRQTWVREWCNHPLMYRVGNMPDYRFCYDGEHDRILEPDEVKFDVPRGKLNTSFKTQAMALWALEQGYEHVFFVPTDCYVCIPRLLVSGFKAREYTGYQVPVELHAGGGSGYWANKRTLEAIVGFEPKADYEDRWVGAAARARGITCYHDPRYWSWEQPWLAGIITAHLSDPDTAAYDPKMMYAYHKQYLERHEIWPIPPIQTC